MKRYKKLISLVLTLLMVLALLPASLTAEGTGTAAASSGESALPEQYITVEPQVEGASEPVTGAVDAIDLSEMQLFGGATKGPLKYDMFDLNGGQGGNTEMALAAVTRWADPINESVNPYPAPAGTNSTANIVYKTGTTAAKLVKDVNKVPRKAADQPLDNSTVKDALIRFGAAYASLWWDYRYEDSTKGTYYLPKNANLVSTGGGHAITVVGWDDNYAASNFSSSFMGATPPGPGAFIIKNSWGTSAGQSGYYYVSYYDRFLLSVDAETAPADVYSYDSEEATFFTGITNTDEYSGLFSWDDFGASSSLSMTTTNYAYYANKFYATTTQQIAAVSFYTYNFNDNYKVYVNPIGSGTLINPASLPAPNATGAQVFPGYHTVDLPSNVTIPAGQWFEVVVAVQNAAGKVYIPVESEFANYNSRVTFAANQSFAYSGGQWKDLYTLFPGDPCNACIKAFTAGTHSGGIPSESSLVTGGSGEQPSTPGDTNVPGSSEPVLPGTSQIPGASDANSTIGESDIPLGQSDIQQPVPGSTEQTESAMSTEDSAVLTNDNNEPRAAFLSSTQTSEGPLLGGTDENGHTFGAIPAPVDYFKGRDLSTMAEPVTGGGLPVTYNLNTDGRVTSVKDQAHFGACWTFATMASIESSYLTEQMGELLTNATITGSHYVSADLFMPIELSVPANALITAYSWSIIEGADVVQSIGAPTQSSCQFAYKTANKEGKAVVACTLTLSDGTTKTLQHTLVVACYGYDPGTLNKNDGSAAHPFEVSTPMGLQLIDCFSGTPSQGLCFKQTASFAAPAGWNPIGESGKPFMGTYDGDNKEISNLQLTPSDLLDASRRFGLFSTVSGATIRNVMLSNVGSTIDFAGSGSNYIFGGIAAVAQEKTKIENCSVNGVFNLCFSNANCPGIIVGGLAGIADNTAITHCGFFGNIIADSTLNNIGGLVGLATGATVTTSYAGISLTGNSANNNTYMGGLTGDLQGVPSTFTNCYAVGGLTSTGGFGGGLTGTVRAVATYTNCYTSTDFTGFSGSGSVKAVVSPFTSAAVRLNNCYYNKTAAGNAAAASGIKGLTAQQMALQASFAGFSFTPNTGSWVMVPGQNHGFPVLQKPLSTPISFSIVEFDNKIYVTEQSTVQGFFSPEYAWPQPVTMVPEKPEIAKGTASGTVLGLKRGLTKLEIKLGSQTLGSINFFYVFDKKGDLDHNATPDYLKSVQALIAFLAGKPAPSDDACWLLDADNSCADQFTADAGDLTLSDLLIMQQANAGVDKNLKNVS